MMTMAERIISVMMKRVASAMILLLMPGWHSQNRTGQKRIVTNMIERYIELRIITDFYIPLIIIISVAVLCILVGTMRWISNSWKKRQDRMNEKYFKEHPDEE